VARRKEALEALVASLGVPCAVYAVDVADAAAIRAAGEDFTARHGVPDIAIANAGISVGTLGGEADDIPVLDRVLRTNVVGLAATLQPFVEPMRRRGEGTLVGVASVAGFRGLPGAGAYSASKAAAIAWLESLRVELHGTGVSVVTLCPGYIDTPLTQVNRYPMPFLLPVDEATRRFAQLIDAHRSYAVVPWQMALVGYILRRLPNRVYDALASRAGRKPRKLPL
jgi:NAD(P)-dependent dehydrogenase (short-subunit alcohol dehydrogenase family)